jgi:protein-L-isoaspartate(D-aspartate) O-methyltransferase
MSPVAETIVDHRRRLVDCLVAAGAIRSEPVRQAFLDVGREQFVPRYQRRHGSDVRWMDGTELANREEWLRGVYTDEVLVVQSRAASDLTNPDGAPTSSSSMPSVMAGMLEALDLRPGMRVLEIGTGTGYNAALLCRLVGDDNVVTVELDPALAEAARNALHRANVHPTVHIGDGRAPLAGQPRFDRVVATAAADHVPPAWIGQLTDDGAIVVDLRGSLAGGLTHLRRTADDRVEGAFLDLAGAFMPLRATIDSPHRDGERWDRPLDMINPQLDATDVDPTWLADTGLRLLVQLHLGGKRLRGFLPDTDATTWSGHADDGSWFTVDTVPDADGLRRVRQGGPQRLWDTITAAMATWQRLDRPPVNDFRVTAQDHERLQQVTCSRRAASYRWPLPL